MKKNLFITLDGVDGVGKTETVRLLTEALNAVSFKSPSEPFLSTRNMVDIEIIPLVRYFFFRAATQNDSKKIEKILNEGKTVVCDRYIYSTFAYHIALDKEISKITEDTGLCKPDLAILLTAPSDIRRERLNIRKQKNEEYYRTLEDDWVFQNTVQSVFKTFNMFEVDTHINSPNEVVKIIIDKLISIF